MNGKEISLDNRRYSEFWIPCSQMDLTNELAGHSISVIFTKFWVQKMFLTYVVSVTNYQRKFVIDVHTQLCYTIKQFTDEIIFNT